MKYINIEILRIKIFPKCIFVFEIYIDCLGIMEPNIIKVTEC